MNRWNQRQCITFVGHRGRIACGVVVAAALFGLTQSLAQAELTGDAPEGGIAEVSRRSETLDELLRELYRRLGGNPNALPPAPKAAMLQIMLDWEVKGLPDNPEKPEILAASAGTRDCLLRNPPDVDPSLIEAFRKTLDDVDTRVQSLP